MDDRTILETYPIPLAGAYRRYHAAMMRTLLVGEADPRHLDMHRACVEALDACTETCRAGRTMGEVFDVHAQISGVGHIEGVFGIQQQIADLLCRVEAGWVEAGQDRGQLLPQFTPGE